MSVTLRSIALSVLRNLDAAHAADDASHGLRAGALATLRTLDAGDCTPVVCAPSSCPTERAWYLDVPRDAVEGGPFLK